MPLKKPVVPFIGTPEQEKELLAYIVTMKGVPGVLMPVLQKAQEIYGYLPIEVQRIVARELGISLEDVYKVVTFYSQFSLNPKGDYRISVCLGTACYVKGAGDIHKKIAQILDLEDKDITPDRKFSLEACRCIGACGLAPVITINEEVYGRLSVDDIPDILAKYQKA